MSQITPYDFVGTPIENKDGLIQFPASIFPRSYESILFYDSIFKFYPYGEVHLKDEVGTVIDTLYFSEGFEWNFKLGSSEYKIKRNGILEELGYLNHNYAWSESLFTNKQITSHLSGIQSFIFISSLFMKDDHKSYMYKDMKISDIVKQIVNNNYGITSSNKLFITQTTGVDSWPQYGKLDRELIENLSLSAFNETKSPFISFINCNGEFYFMSIQELLQQKSIGTYSLKFTETSVADDWAIQDYKILFGGLPINRNNYHNTSYVLKGDGTMEDTIHLLKNYYVKQNAKDKFTIRNKVIDNKNRSLNLGIRNSNDRENYLGKVNNLYLNTDLSYRMEIVVKFNPQAVAGKVLNIEIGNPNNTGKLAEFAGNWLICESKHTVDDNGIPYQILLVAKSTAQIKQTNPYAAEFI